MDNRPVAAVILGAGKGTRLNDVTSPFSKTLLLVNDLPVIGYAVRAVEPYVDRIVLVAHPTTAARTYEAAVHSRKHDSTEIVLAVQDQPLGMADAMGAGFTALEEDHVVVVIAGDNIILDEGNVRNTLRLVEPGLSKLAWTFKELPPDEARRFSVYQELGEGKGKLIEKPQNPPGKVCWCGPVAFSSSVEALRRIGSLLPSLRGEYEATDLMNTYLLNGESSHVRLSGEWFDIGTPESLEVARKTISQVISNL